MEMNFRKWLNEDIGTIGNVGMAPRPAGATAPAPAGATAPKPAAVPSGQQGQPNNTKKVSDNTKKVSELIKKDFMGSGTNINDVIKKSINNKNMAGVKLVAAYAASNKIILSAEEINDAIAALQGQ